MLKKEALHRQEGVLANTGSLVVDTGKRTGRSPKDRFLVCDENTSNTICWNSINQAMDPKDFKKLWEKAEKYLKSKDKIYHQSFIAGQDLKHAIRILASTEYAWHMLFLNNLLMDAEDHEADHLPAWTLWVAPDLKLDPTLDPSATDGIVAIDLTNKKILIIGILYAGEMKKSIFSVMNYWLPMHHVLSMHCAANQGNENDVALFFGLSGTGKTTLSADPKRQLIGDDEHGWSEDGIFNIENGCYAKCYGLHPDKEPLIYQAINEKAVLENIVLNEAGIPQYDDASRTLNTRAAYPLQSINPCINPPLAGHPEAIFMLSCDLFGVLPALSMLSIEQALFWFLNGYTAHIGSTEYGSSGIRYTFSTCFGAPFFPRNPETYALLLEEKLLNHNIQVYLINTGYYGGSIHQKGKRFPLSITRELVDLALKKTTLAAPKQEGPFGLSIPLLSCQDFDLKHPISFWEEPEHYIRAQRKLQSICLEHFEDLPLSEAFRKKMANILC